MPNVRVCWPMLAALLLVATSGCANTAARHHDDAASPSPHTLPWHDARQMVLVTTADWAVDTGVLQRYQRDGGGPWQPVGDATPVTVGRSGTAWGTGLHPAQPGDQKREGDGRAPAGVFAIGTAFGYAPDAATALPYQAMDVRDWCIDVPASPLYNRIVDEREVGREAVQGSTEPMRRDLHADGDQRYRWGLVIDHNPQRTPGGGSCIFAHLWQAPGVPTAGCTAMPEPAMQALLEWLRPEAEPVFVLLPQAERDRLTAAWRLPPAGR